MHVLVLQILASLELWHNLDLGQRELNLKGCCAVWCLIQTAEKQGMYLLTQPQICELRDSHPSMWEQQISPAFVGKPNPMLSMYLMQSNPILASGECVLSPANVFPFWSFGTVLFLSFSVFKKWLSNIFCIFFLKVTWYFLGYIEVVFLQRKFLFF